MNGAWKNWVLKPPQPEEAARLAQSLGVSPVTAQLLLNRNQNSLEQARAFLQPSLNDLHDPWGLPDAEKAAARISEAVTRGERIVVYGDYDVDGVTATALLVKCLRLMGADVRYYVPDRMEEGYGLNENAIRQITGEGAKLIITADCGVTADVEIILARKLGADVIVTDHHEAGPHGRRVIENAYAVVSALREDSAYPFKGLSGVGVAFKLAWAIGKTLSGGRRCSPEFQDFLLDAVALVSLGTIADVVPLVGENRALASYGLGGLSCSENPGLRALRRCASVDGKGLTAFDVAFKLAPRINAAGRLGTALKVVEMLTTDSDEKAQEIALFLTSENARRQKIQEQILTQSLAMIAAGRPLDEMSALVLASPGWHPGVVGVVASKLVERFHLPTVILCIDGDDAQGSARSVAGLHLFDALAECDDLLRRYGGHALAAGLRLSAARIAEFRDKFLRIAAERMSPEDRIPKLALDAEVPLSSLSLSLMGELNRLEPFGQGNPVPLFAAFELKVAGQVQRMGSKGSHLGFWVRQDDTALRAVAFGRGDMADKIQSAGLCSLAYRPNLNEYRGVKSLELRVEDIRLGPPRAE